ncbi:glucose-1-phosphate adenylyltransferase subunit GlgD [Aerococcaceae bacterium DSM 111022]|nr:glucose-1-phosphate adenylyltransferase subunit GlgD [Aerococcaceae bacterium DSM 111022]
MAKNKLSAIINLTEDHTVTLPLTNARPIAALPFAGRYRVIDFVLSAITYAEIDSVAMFIGESGRSIYDHVRSGESWDLDNKIRGGIFTYSQQNWKKQHHTENDIEDFYYNHRLYLERSKTDYVFVSGSSVIANADLQNICTQHVASGKDITVIYSPVQENLESIRENNRIFLVEGEQDEVRAFGPQDVATSDKLNVSLNSYILSVDKMNEIMEQALADGIYLDVDALLEQYLSDLTINAYEYTGFAKKINSIESYYEANMSLLDRKKFASLLQTSIPVLTKRKNGSPTYYDAESKVRQSIIGSDTSIFGEVTDSVINRRVEVAKDASVTNSILLQGVKVGEGAKIEYAIIDKNTVVEPGAQIIGSPDDLVVIAKGSHIEA